MQVAMKNEKRKRAYSTNVAEFDLVMQVKSVLFHFEEIVQLSNLFK